METRAGTPEARRAIEHEENEQRKPLTDYERSKRRVEEAEEVAPEIEARKAAEFSGTLPKNSGRHAGGRPPKTEATREERAQAIGQSERTLRRAEQHVAAVEGLGVPEALPQATALRTGRRCRMPRIPKTTIEASRALVERAREAAATIGNERSAAGLSLPNECAIDDLSSPITGGHRQAEYGVPKDAIASRIGVDRTALIRAEQHLAAVEEFPHLRAASQGKAIATAKRLRAWYPTSDTPSGAARARAGCATGA